MTSDVDIFSLVSTLLLHLCRLNVFMLVSTSTKYYFINTICYLSLNYFFAGRKGSPPTSKCFFE